MMAQAKIPLETKTSEMLTYRLASDMFSSEKLRPRKRWTPFGIPKPAMMAIIAEKDTTLAEIPIISGEPTLEIIIQNAYPEIIATIASM